MSLSLSDLQALLPELALLVLMGLVMLLDLVWHPPPGIGWVDGSGPDRRVGPQPGFGPALEFPARLGRHFAP